MNATQEHLLKLILEIDRICKKYDIQYFLEYGSVLGAIRHEGFIPWDDDMDVILTEDNYNRWVEACEKELDGITRVYSDGRLNRGFPTVFGRYIDLTTTRVGDHGPFYQNICGQCIDVFYLIELPGNPIKKQKAIDRYFAYDEYMNISFRHDRAKTERWMKLYKRYCLWGKIFGREHVLRHLEKKIFNHHYEDCDYYLVTSARGKGRTTIIPKKYYDTVCTANIEGYEFPIPGMYVEDMTQYYGDTYCLLPEKQRQHSKMSFSNLGCANYVEDYLRYIDKQQLLKDRWAFKNLHVKEGYWATRHASEFFEKLASYERLRIERTIQKNGIVIADHIKPSEQSELTVLDNLFDEYYNKQLHSAPWYWELYLDIGDELLFPALFNLIYYRYDYSSAAKILRLRMLQNFPVSSGVEAMNDLVLLIRKVKAEMQYRNLKEADELLLQGLKKYPHCRMLLMDRLTLNVLFAESIKDYTNCEREANELLEIYPEDEQGVKALGDIAWARKNYATAEQYYDWLMEHSLNGMIHLDIKKKRDAIHD